MIYVLYKRETPIAQGSMEHCLDVYYWERSHGYSKGGYKVLPINWESDGE